MKKPANGLSAKTVIDQRYWAELSGRLLDEVDEIVREYVGASGSFIGWLNDPEQTELTVLFSKEQYSPVLELINDCFVRYEFHIPWLQKIHRTQFVSFFEAMAETFDLGFEYLKPEGSKKDEKHEIVRHFSRLMPDKVKPSNAKKIPDITKKTEFITQFCLTKLKQREQLTPREELWMRHQGYLVRFFKHGIQHDTARTQLQRAASDAARKFSSP